MRVFLDENMPRGIGNLLAPHSVSHVEGEGWKGKQNGELLSLVEQSFDVFLTADNGLSFQNELTRRALSLILVPTNNWLVLRDSSSAVLATLNDLADWGRPSLVMIGWTGRRRARWLNEPRGRERELTPVMSFTRRVP